MTPTSFADSVLHEPAPAKLAQATLQIARGPIESIEASLPGALAGERYYVRTYVNSYRELAAAVLEQVGPAEWPEVTLAQEAMSAPFSEWVRALGAGKGTAVAMIDHLRRVLPGVEPLNPPSERRPPSWKLDELRVMRFYRAVLDEFEREHAPLVQLVELLELSHRELAQMFGVSRQALEQWRQRGVPSERQEKLATLGEIADLLAAKLKRDRIPGVVRRPAEAYGGRSILQAIADDEQDMALEQLREAFDWAAAA